MTTDASAVPLAAPSASPLATKAPKSYPQAGVTNRPQEHLLLLACLFTSSANAHATLGLLSALVKDELTSKLGDVTLNAAGVQPETGELGFGEHHDRAHLTITLGVSSTGFDALGGERPADIRQLPWSDLENGVVPGVSASGDFILQICADDMYIVEHVARRVEVEFADSVSIVWSQLGSQRYTSRPGRTSKREGRALIGFVDGSSNLDPRNNPDDRALVYVDPATVSTYPQPDADLNNAYSGTMFAGLPPVPTEEPAWAKDGTYMVARVSTFDAQTWDSQTLAAQQAAVGRFKATGVSLDLNETTNSPKDPPAFAANPNDLTVAVNAHVRKANPRRVSESDLQRRILRRGYPIIDSNGGSLRRGLAFVCFGRTISTQFEFIMRAWIRNANFPGQGSGEDALLQSSGSATGIAETIISGGYYFVPAVKSAAHPWDWILPPPVV